LNEHLYYFDIKMSRIGLYDATEAS